MGVLHAGGIHRLEAADDRLRDGLWVVVRQLILLLEVCLHVELAVVRAAMLLLRLRIVTCIFAVPGRGSPASRSRSHGALPPVEGVRLIPRSPQATPRAQGDNELPDEHGQVQDWWRAQDH